MNCEACGHENLEGAHFCAKCGVQLSSETADGESWVGRLVGGRFRVNRVLGEGGMGIVYEGEQQMGSTVRRVAIKTLHPHLSNDPSVLARFHRECGTVAELEHPNTIKFYDFGKESDGTLYIAMEFLDGDSLDKVIEKEGALPPSRTVKVMHQICGALDEAHEKGVVHRDLKPENVVLSERLGEKDFVKVLDFGIAARSESSDREKEAKLTQQGMVLGTPPYMSPEQFTGEELDRRSDVYSLGVMAYEMLTGQLPFTANTPWQWATEHMTAQPFPIDQVPTGSAVPRPMREAVMRALAKDPADRPQTAGEFLKELEDGLAGAAAVISAPTEQMQAVPAFAAGPNSAPASMPISTTTQSEMSATQGIEIPKQKSNGPMIIGGVAVVALLAGAAIVFGGKGGDTGKEEDPAAASAGGEDEKAPGSEKPEAGEEKPNETGEEKKPEESKKPQKPATGPSPIASPSPSPAPDPAPAPAPEPAPQPVPQPTGPDPKDVCSACISAAQSRNWSAAKSAYNSCSATGQQKCSVAARSVSKSAITSLVKAGNCKKARSEANGAAAINGISPIVQVAAKTCK